MSPEVRAALDSACSVGLAEPSIGRPARRRSMSGVRALVYAVVEGLPGDMTLAELAEELSINSNQSV